MPAVLTAFDDETPDLDWRVVNDNVMGGRSQGGFRIVDGVLVFSGSTNTNGGGFSSIPSAGRPAVPGDATAVRLRLRGDGRRYIVRLENTDGVAFWADFQTCSKGEWETVSVPFTRFVPRFRGRRLVGPVLAPAQIAGIGLMIYDGEDGPFRLEVDRIEAE